ncbi:carbohydrate ABC transporter permease [Corynebacterium choanae]|uniref:L-arabinose transport system permease protein AraQ n=1 Tax=Corynebacterium choanae TaxID=1862358 RepID=A0A3G6J3E4_9CORY|nr:carbohydrate ABC transporter permease [Corynebacterium choanae]AZA12591.1 L-arabinose transport system permease protein AraQ [Corynebacterium choanae]
MTRENTATLPDGRTYTPSKGNVPQSLKPKPLTTVIIRAALLIVAIYFMLPVYWLLISATKSDNGLTESNGFWFAPQTANGRNIGGFHLVENYQGLMAYSASHGHYWRWVGNSVLYSVSAGVIGVLVSVMAGYALSKFKFRGSALVQGCIMAGLLMPVALLSVPLYLLFSEFGLLNNPLAVIIPSAVSPFGVFLARVYVEASVPDELLEAARIDGAGEFRIFFTMVLRLLAPAMVTIFLFIFVATWNNFLLPLIMMTDESQKPVTVALYGMLAYFDPDKGQVLLGALMAIAPVVVLFTFLQRFWQSGLAAGSVKG